MSELLEPAKKKKRKQPETKISSAIREYGRLMGYVVLRLNTVGRFIDRRYVPSYVVYGMPTAEREDGTIGTNDTEGGCDLFFFKGDGVRCEAFLFEVKTKTGKLEPSQKRFATFCGLYGVPVNVVRSVEDVIEVIDDARKVL